MPYIDPVRARELFVGTRSPETPGDLNYVISEILVDYITLKGLNYQTINDISGALNECLAEFRRRIVGQYEQTKINGGGKDPYATIAPENGELFENWIGRLTEEGIIR